MSYIFLNHFAPNVGWRLAFLLGPVLALVVIIVGRVLPESPRWLVTHGRQDEADKVMAKIEEAVRKSGRELAPIDENKAIEIVPETRYGYLTFLRLVFHQYPRRAILGATLMITQSFVYNAIYFTYALVLINFYHVPSNKIPLYGLAFSIGNLIGPLVLGPLFDSWGRKQMIAGTYIVSAVLLAWSAVMFAAGVLNATTQTLMWVVIFFFAIGSIAGAIGPVFYGALIGTGSSRTGLFIGYLIGGAIMLTGGLVEVFLGVNAAGKSLEQATKPVPSRARPHDRRWTRKSCPPAPGVPPEA